MANLKFFLDTGAVIALSGLEGLDLQIFKNRINASNSELSVTHIQVDETHRKELQDYQKKIKKALESLTNKGIIVQVEPTKIAVLDISRLDHSQFGNEEVGKLYDELRKEIEKCEGDKGTKKKPSNIACDAIISVSSLDHDFFITCDKCVHDCWFMVISKYGMLGKQFKIPKVIYATPNAKEVAKAVLDFILTLSQ